MTDAASHSHKTSGASRCLRRSPGSIPERNLLEGSVQGNRRPPPRVFEREVPAGSVTPSPSAQHPLTNANRPPP